MKPNSNRVVARYLEAREPPHLDVVGRQVYVRGNTYAFRDDLRAMGAKWDRDEGAWWISTTKAKTLRDKLDALLDTLAVPRATRKQVDYLEKLHDSLGKRVGRDYLERIPMAEASQLIDTLKAELNAKPKSHAPANSASPKQINYALSLLNRISPREWFDTDMGDSGMGKPTRADLEGWDRKDVSALIDELKDGW